MIVLVCLLVACGGDAARIGLEARSIEDRSASRDYVPSAPGSRLVAVGVRLLNATEAPIALGPMSFALESTTDELASAHALTASLGDACAGMLEPGSTATCSVAFELPDGFGPELITYSFGVHTVRARLPLGGDGGSGIPLADAGAPSPTNELDLLFAIDNSGSMTEEQASLTAELPRLLTALSSGDLDGDGRTDGPDDMPPFDLHVAVITTDMGTGGFTVPTCARADFGDDGILQVDGRTDIAGCMATYPSFLTFRPGGTSDPDALARDATCVATVGNSGCGFEQQLEAVLKALSPSAPTAWTRPGYRPPTFFRSTVGHGDRENDGFVRADSVLAVVIVSDEEDCSARDPELFNPSSPTYGATDLNLRCFAHADAALHPISRFVGGFVELRRSASRLVYMPIVGIPVDIAPAPGERPSWEHLIDPDPSRRDDRMEERVDPAMPSRLQPSCNVPGRGVAFPPVRIVQVARELERAGARVSLGSICQETFERPISTLIESIRDAARGG